MKIIICDRCKARQVEGIVCRHCGDTAWCYDCLESHPQAMRTCPECGKFLCEECYNGMVECDLKKKKEKQ